MTLTTFWLSTSPAAVTAAESAGSGIPTQIVYAGIAGLAVGGVIAFVQSRRRRRDDAGHDDD
ncbi:uncharacterized protein involved in exopolysaccharide biosynthesis [Mycolicibacterium sp. BK556]|uniref:hypothetical protein n=1 Tax=Mycobacteriaceae TaxID=1762 RepID=UPI0010D10A98|nr:MULTISPECIES: hypothetical protein [Mycobacteriaceae]MBB3604042.1 uncharacterized protein involved in exopolysaccharide biosynthesis [Mycolicibacterium sp. BK556]MBB3634238.1 uncharacterized protein involved in exopolysaccharide biosynthesis [Mycolicibacterium sp. BK607]MBB3751818.1 uncharacterized protein involved in exopolysaccharide biosynthesis [Mycolicibacterium sp. BK634]TDO12335.1 hypothetical protein EV580_4061 [Mycobacterium sp. BK086]